MPTPHINNSHNTNVSFKTTKRAKVELYNKLSTGLYREVLDSPTGLHIRPLVKAVCLAFTDLHELT